MKIEQNSATFGAMLFVVTFVFLIQNKFVIEENISGLTLFFFFLRMNQSTRGNMLYVKVLVL